MSPQYFLPNGSFARIAPLHGRVESRGSSKKPLHCQTTAVVQQTSAKTVVLSAGTRSLLNSVYRQVMAPILGYCDFRGLAGSLRSLLYYTGTEFEDKKYHMGPPPDFERSEWLKDKPKLGLDFPNFPFYVDGDLKMTQSLAILRHLGRKHGLTPEDTEEDVCRADVALQQITDVLLGFGRLAYNPNFDTEKVVYIKDLPDKLGPFSKFMGDNPWLLGENLTYVDFLFYELLDFHRFLAPDVVNSFDNFKDFIQRFESLPNIEKYHKSGQYINWPLFSPHAKFGGSSDPPSV